MLNKQKGNMYGFVTHTFNIIKGKCPHNCPYCYMKRRPQKELSFDSRELRTDLGNGKFIFVGSSCDMFAGSIPSEWILKTLNHCRKFNNQYLFQTKNPYRFQEFLGDFPKNSVLCITLETNRESQITAFSPIKDRVSYFSLISLLSKMITIEPVMDFDVEEFLKLIRSIDKVGQINIGADSGNNHLSEPSFEKLQGLIDRLELAGYKLYLKNNLYRLKKKNLINMD